MHKTWQLQDAKNKFSNLVKIAENEGPQIVTKNGKETVVVISVEEYKKLTKPKDNLFEFIQKSPLRGVNIDVKRSKNPSRPVRI